MTNNTPNNHSTNHIPKNDGLIDIQKIIQLAKSNWYLFAISIPLVFASTYVYHRYSKDIYKSSVTIMLKSEETKAMSRTDLIEGFGLSAETNSLESQSLILRSKKVVGGALRKLDFEIDMYSDGYFMDYDLYPSSPYSVTMDTSHVQLLNTPVHIKPIGNNKIKIEIETENAWLHNFQEQKNTSGSGLILFSQTINYGDFIETPFFKFKIDKNPYVKKETKFDYYFYFRSIDWLTNNYRSKINIRPISEGSSIINVSVTGETPAKLTSFLDALCEVYLEDNLDRKNEIAVRTLEFIDTQLVQVSDTLKGTLEKLMQFRKSNIYTAPDEMSSILADQYLEYEKELKLIKLKEKYYKKLVADLKADPLSDDYLLPAFAVDVSPFISTLIKELLTLTSEYKLIGSHTADTNPYQNELRTKIEVGKENLISALNKVISNVEIQEERIEGNISDVKSNLSKLPEAEKAYLDIDREYKLNDAIYTFLLQKQSETKITKASNAPDNEIIDKAVINGVIAPNKAADRKNALMLAFLLPVAIIFLKEYFNNKIRDKNDIALIAPNVPVFGFIPQSKSDNENVIKSDPVSSIAEAFRGLRTKLNFVGNNGNPKVILVTSTNTGEGKTYCALNLASAYAISGKKTVLLGFDLRKPRLTGIYKHESHNGISNYLIGETKYEDILQDGLLDRLTVIPSGVIPPNPSELITGSNTKLFFDKLKEDFDCIIVDSPPIGIVTDARILMNYADCGLFVVRSDKTDKEHFKATIHNLLSDDLPCLGLILNDISKKTAGYGHYAERYYTDK